MKRKITVFSTLLACIVIILAGASASNAQTLQWVRGLGGNGSVTGSFQDGSNTMGSQIAVDVFGNVYTAGKFGGAAVGNPTVDFNPGSGTENRTVMGWIDVYISKLDPSGNYRWVRQLGSPGFAITELSGIAADAAGNVYTTGSFGSFSSSLYLDSQSGPSIVTHGGSDAFLVKLDSAGNLDWALSIGGSGYDQSTDLKLDTAGNVYVVGRFSGTVDFDPGTAASDTFSLTATANESGFVLKLDPQGKFVWVKQVPKFNTYMNLAIDKEANIYIAGVFSGTADFNPGPLTHNLTAIGNSDQFILKLDASGDFVWANQVGASGVYVRAYDITTDPAGNVITIGNFGNIVDFDPGTGTGAVSYLDAANGYQYISKLNSAGHFIWAGQIGGGDTSSLASVTSVSVTTDMAGNIYLTGQFRGSNMDFDPSTDTLQLSSVAMSWNSFILKLETSGKPFWLGQMKSSGSNSNNVYGRAIAVDEDKNIYTTGDFYAAVDFEPGPADSTLYTVDPNGHDAFIQKLGCRSFSALDTAVCGSFYLNERLYDSSGTYTQTLVNAAGCDSLLTINLTITPFDTAVTQQDNTLTARMDHATYQWIDCSDGEAIAGATAQSFTPEMNGHYAVVISNGDCMDTSACYTVNVTGIKGFTEQSFIHVYPNPAHHLITLRTGADLHGATVSIVNMLGQVMLVQEDMNGNLFTFDMRPYAAGVYFLKVSESGRTASVKFVKQ